MKAEIKVYRIAEGYKQTIGQGQLYLNSDCVYTFMTLEKANNHNKRNISSIPTGTYKAEKIHRASNGKKAILLHNVHDRSEILIHAGNYHTHSAGCILAGDKLKDLNMDGFYDITNSNNTTDKLWDLIPDAADLTIEVIKMML